ncbi:MAG TPA: Mov34/MPN/PAD-1 family protein, partial [Gemmatimonadaceae bacterium]|nr:Mov34/MPN/PAD-1 family protein [Gemmatimonadaceae bacterium]
MRGSVLTLRKPIPLARAIRWVPAGLFTPPRTLDDLALFITQSALREVMRHLRSNPEQELLGFLLGELYECPETGARYVVVNAAVRTGHAIAESDRILIPEEEWLGVQLEVRRRRTQLIGWYHSAPFVGPHPARADLDTHRALFTEPWQCGLVIATTGDAPTGAFFRSLMGERTGGGVLIPFYELPDEDEPLPADGRKRTLIDWVNYETRGTVERDESERRPFVPTRPSKPHGTPVILSVPSAPEDELDDDDLPPAVEPRPSAPRAPEPPQPDRKE